MAGAVRLLPALVLWASAADCADPAPGLVPRESSAASTADAQPAPSELGLTPRLGELLERGRWHHTPAGFRIIALSCVADGCAARVGEAPAAARACVARVRALAEALHPEVRGARSPAAGLRLSHYLLILGAADRVGGCDREAEHRRLAGLLAGASLADPTRHLASFVGDAHRWPADQSATLAAIGRADQAHGTGLLAAPLAAWRGYLLAQAIDAETGLPFSEVGVLGPTSRLPRGCALSWQTRYLAEVDRPLAERFWRAYRAHYLVDRIALVGFREWPPGRDRPADVDSGPIVDGVGAAATGLAIGAARAMGDELLAARLELTAAVVGGTARLDPALAHHAESTLAEAIRFAGARLFQPGKPAKRTKARGASAAAEDDGGE